MVPKMYLVGGSVRTKLMNVIGDTDYDFAVEADSYDDMFNHLRQLGVEVWKELPEYVTLRGRMPLAGGVWPPSGRGIVTVGVPADFTLCRKEAMYSDMRHPNEVTPADLATDLSRRDFTMNAIAEDEAGTLIDPYGGIADINDKIIRCVRDPNERFKEDPLRMLRALRFAITLDFKLEYHTDKAVRLHSDLLKSLPVERVQTELTKMFKCSWWRSMHILEAYPGVMNCLLLHDRLWFKPTTEER